MWELWLLPAAAGLGFFFWRRGRREKTAPASSNPGEDVRGTFSTRAMGRPTTGAPGEEKLERLQPGDKVDGYQVLDWLGEGGMATVYRVRSKSSGGETLALKLIKPEHAADPTFRRRFEREVGLSRKLTHPNIVRLVDSGQDGERLYLALEYVDGATMTSLLRPSGMPLASLYPHLEGLLDGLMFAHDLGVVHRDLKPENIMLDAKGQAKIADFGLARSDEAGKVTKTGDSMGTPAYFPPEQITGAQPTWAADQYSLGVMFYELLTGARPFTEKNPLKMLMQHLSDPPPDPRERRPDLDPTLAALLLRMLEKSPENRFASLAEVKEGLRAMAHGEPWQMSAKPTTDASAPVTPAPTLTALPSNPSSFEDDSTLGFQVSSDS